MNNIEYSPSARLSKNIILVDGITRTGKLLLGSLISSFDRMEHLEFGENFEFIVPAIKFKKVELNFGKSYLNNYLRAPGVMFGLGLLWKDSFHFSSLTIFMSFLAMFWNAQYFNYEVIKSYYSTI